MSHITLDVWWPVPCCIWPIVCPGERGDLAPIKLVSTLHFNLYPRGLQSLLRQPTLSGWDQEAIGARVTLTPLCSTLDFGSPKLNEKNEKLYMKPRCAKVWKLFKSRQWGWIFKTFHNENTRQQGLWLDRQITPRAVVDALDLYSLLIKVKERGLDMKCMHSENLGCISFLCRTQLSEGTKNKV